MKHFVCLLLSAPLFLVVQLHAENPTSAPAAEQKAAMDVLDGVISRFQALLDRDDDATHKAATQTVLDGFKQRRETLLHNFDQGRYDELRVDLNLEYQRLANWMRPPITPASKPSATGFLFPSSGTPGEGQGGGSFNL